MAAGGFVSAAGLGFFFFFFFEEINPQMSSSIGESLKLQCVLISSRLAPTSPSKLNPNNDNRTPVIGSCL